MSNYAQYFAIEKKLKSQGFDFERHELISQFTDNKKDSLKGLSYFEYAEFLRWINKKFAAMPSPEQELKDKCQLMRRKLIALFYKMNYRTPEGKSDMVRINQWCAKYGKFHKELNGHSYQELTQLLTQAEAVYKSYIQSL